MKVITLLEDLCPRWYRSTHIKTVKRIVHIWALTSLPIRIGYKYMKRIPVKIRKLINDDLEYHNCMLRAYHPHVCGGRITIEHALIYAGRQADFKNALISVCARGQEVDEYQDAHTMDKKLNVWVALNRMTDEEIESISKTINYRRLLDQLNAIYGEYRAPVNDSFIKYSV